MFRFLLGCVCGTHRIHGTWHGSEEDIYAPAVVASAGAMGWVVPFFFLIAFPTSPTSWQLLLPPQISEFVCCRNLIIKKKATDLFFFLYECGSGKSREWADIISGGRLFVKWSERGGRFVLLKNPVCRLVERHCLEQLLLTPLGSELSDLQTNTLVCRFVFWRRCIASLLLTLSPARSL